MKLKLDKKYRSLDIGTLFWIQFNTCRHNYRCGISYETDAYTNSIEFALFYPTLTFGYSRKRFRAIKKEWE